MAEFVNIVSCRAVYLYRVNGVSFVPMIYSLRFQMAAVLFFRGFSVIFCCAGVWLITSNVSSAQSSRPGLGSIPYADGAGTGVTFRVWAPNATNVDVRGEFSGWNDIPLVTEGGGQWSLDVPGALEGQQYRYRINNTSLRRDPRSRRVTNSGANGNSIIYHTNAFNWGGVEIPKPGRKDTVIYQMHIGTFAGSPTPRTFDHATNYLDHVKDLGINAIKVMPVNEFAGGQSWGYNPADLFAIESAYGGPDAFKRFVRACHERDIAVFVDVVHNHYGPSDLSLWRFDGWWQGNYGGIYFYNDTRAHTPWGSTRPDYGRSQVRDFIRDQIMMYVLEYRIGGFRWDAPYYIINSDWGHNQTGEHMLRDINWHLQQNYPYVQRIAEDNAFDYSMNFQGQWDVAGRWSLHGQVTTGSDANRNMFTVRNLLRDWASLNRVLFSEAHDYIASNHGRSRLPSEIDSGNPESIWARKRSLLAAGIVMTAPAMPMIFQGQEMLETQAFHDNVPLRWTRTNSFSGIVRSYTDLIHVRRNLRGGSKGLKGTGINVHHVDNNNKVIAYIRWDAGGQTDDAVVVANFANINWTNNNYSIAFPSDGVWYSHYNGDSTNYQADFGNIGTTQLIVSGGAAYVNMGRYSMQIFTREPPAGAPQPGLASVVTAPITEITETAAKGGGEVIDDGGTTVIERGVVWNTLPLPTTNDFRNAAGSGLGMFTNTLTGLSSGVVYYTRAYAINSAGIAYGEEVLFETGGVSAPGLGVEPLQITFSAMLGGNPIPAGQPIVITNFGTGMLFGDHHFSYGSGPSGWLGTSMTNFSVVTGGSAVHTVFVNSASFTETGVFIATNRIDGNQTNNPAYMEVTLTITNIPSPSSVSAVHDGAEMVRLSFSEPQGRTVLIVYRSETPPDVSPANGVTYHAGGPLGAGHVLFKISGAVNVTNLEHVVAPGTKHFYEFYTINNDRYSPAITAVATTEMYRIGAIVESFAYTNAVIPSGLMGGLGWTNAWTITVPRTNTDVVINGGNFGNFPSAWPQESGNRLVFATTNPSLYAAFRKFNAVTNGRIYVATLYRRQHAEGLNDGKFSGVSFFDGATERAFVGERGSSGNDDIFGVSISGISQGVHGSPDSFPAGVDYQLVGRYDFDTRIMSGIYFTNVAAIPESEPLFLLGVTGIIARIDGIRLASGANSGFNGLVHFDEVRIARSWNELWQVSAPEGQDSDGDGIPDWWMTGHFGSPTGKTGNLSMPYQDADDDGMTNLEEYIAGTDPTDHDSQFVVNMDGSGLLWFSTIHGRIYQLERHNGDDTDWLEAITNISGGSGPYMYPAAGTMTTHWYRARVRLAD